MSQTGRGPFTGQVEEGMRRGRKEQAHEDRVVDGVGPEEADLPRLNGPLADAVVPFLGTLVGRRRGVRRPFREIVSVRTLAELDRPTEERAEGDEDGQKERQ